MKKTPFTILSTDWHLKESNIEQITDLVRQKCELAKSLGIKIVFCLGDIFDSRASQKVSLLTAFDSILDVFKEYEIQLVAIPGNHDKTQYLGNESFLTPFKYHPYFKLVEGIDCQSIGDEKTIINFFLFPYYKESIWFEKYQEFMKDFVVDEQEKSVLLSHIALNGSQNNDGSQVSNNISVTDFAKWDLVLLGHYHNKQQLSQNVFHIPSIQQNNYGETTEKGFIVLYSDCSFEVVKSKFKEFEKITIDLDTTSKTDLNKLVKEYSKSDKNIRFELVGSTENVKAVNKDEISATGIDVKIKVKSVEESIQLATQEIKEYNKTSIVDEFEEFCKLKNKDFEKGMVYLTKKLN